MSMSTNIHDVTGVQLGSIKRMGGSTDCPRVFYLRDLVANVHGGTARTTLIADTPEALLLPGEVWTAEAPRTLADDATERAA